MYQWTIKILEDSTKIFEVVVWIFDISPHPISDKKNLRFVLRNK